MQANDTHKRTTRPGTKIAAATVCLLFVLGVVLPQGALPVYAQQPGSAAPPTAAQQESAETETPEQEPENEAEQPGGPQQPPGEDETEPAVEDEPDPKDQAEETAPGEQTPAEGKQPGGPGTYGADGEEEENPFMRALEDEPMADTPVSMIGVSGTSTLTILDGGAYTVTGDTTAEGLFDENTAISAGGSLTIQLDNATPANMRFMDAGGANVTVQGTGSLTLRSTDKIGDSPSAMLVYNLIVAGGSLDVHGELIGIDVQGKLTVTGGKVAGYHNEANILLDVKQNGVYVWGDVEVSGGTLYGQGGGGTSGHGGDGYLGSGHGSGLYVLGDIFQSGGEVTGFCVSYSHSRAGIIAEGNIYLSESAEMNGIAEENPISTYHYAAYGVRGTYIEVRGNARLTGTGGGNYGGGVYAKDVTSFVENETGCLRVMDSGYVRGEGWSAGVVAESKLLAQDNATVQGDIHYIEGEGVGTSGGSGINAQKNMYSEAGNSAVGHIYVSGSAEVTGGSSNIRPDNRLPATNGVLANYTQVDDAGTLTGKGWNTGVTTGNLLMQNGSIEGTAPAGWNNGYEPTAGVSIAGCTQNGGSIAGHIEGNTANLDGQPIGGVVITRNTDEIPPIVLNGGTMTGTLPDDLRFENAYGIFVPVGVPTTTGGEVTGTARGNIGVYVEDGIVMTGAETDAVAGGTLTGLGGHTGVYSGSAISVAGGALVGTSLDAQMDEADTRAGVYSAAGGIAVGGGSVTGTTNQYYTTSSGAVNANEEGIVVENGGTVTEIYNTPYQRVNNTQWGTPFAGVSLTVNDDEFPLYTWQVEEDKLELDAALGVRALQTEGTAQLTATRNGPEGDKNNMTLGSAGNRHVVQFSVFLAVGPDEPGSESYTVMFDPNGGSFTGTPPEELLKEAGETVTAEEALAHAVARPGFTFTGWAVNSEDGPLHDFEEGPYTVEENVTFVAVWAPVEPEVDPYTVTFDPNGGSFTGTPPEELLKEAGETVTAEEALAHAVARPGFTFTGWAVNSEDGPLHDFEEGPYTVEEDVTFVAVWAPVEPEVDPYTVTFDPNGGSFTGTPPEELLKEAGETVTAEEALAHAVARPGFTFTGWAVNSEDGPLHDFEEGPYTVEENVTFVAVWAPVEPEVDPYTVTFDPNGGSFTGTPPEELLKEAGETVTEQEALAHAVARPGFTFTGWAVNSEDGPLHDFEEGPYTVEADVTFVAVWAPVEPEVDPYTVTFDPNGGSFTGTPPEELLKEAGETVTEQEALAHAVARPGFTFTGWAVNSEDGPLHDFEEGPYTVEENVTFVAVWEQRNIPYTIYYILDGTENEDVPTEIAPRLLMSPGLPMGSSIDEADDPLDLHEKYRRVGHNLPCILELEAETFAMPLAAEPGVPVRLLDLPNTIVVRYEIRTFTIRYEDPDGNVIREEEVPYGEDGTPPQVPLRDGEEFTGWEGDYTNVTSDRVIVAQYEPVPAGASSAPPASASPAGRAPTSNAPARTPRNSVPHTNAPRTGDTNTAPFVALVVAGAAGLAVLAYLRRKNKRGEQHNTDGQA